MNFIAIKFWFNFLSYKIRGGFVFWWLHWGALGLERKGGGLFVNQGYLPATRTVGVEAFGVRRLGFGSMRALLVRMSQSSDKARTASVELFLAELTWNYQKRGGGEVGRRNLTGKELQFKTFCQWSLLHSMIFIGNCKAFVQLTSLPESLRLRLVFYKILDP